MDSLTTGPVADVLAQLLVAAEAADRPLHDGFANGSYSEVQMLSEEAGDFRKLYQEQADYFLNVSPDMGRFLYLCARSRRPRQVVEFGTSFGISTIYLASALSDCGGGRLISTELEPAKAERARENVEAAGLADLVEIRVGDARETLRDGGEGDVDMVLLDGAYMFYLPVLKLLEPKLTTGAPVVADNAIDLSNAYLDYVQEPRNGYLTLALPFQPYRGHYLSVYTA
ncbi:methyltransferase family protein [Halopolyspora algeriensis]|uniref:Methyltransferase family protein n=1 Tax=Halopolyspora algeriensis TaxID=1500506 RepID=A0A368V946_9ACTN|nr:class I SAM-dependent methyltransferase [Halopolyspora algeriensis]RCW37656.1 methyltransferase family protein [Halopolyspora algeriensis]TQM53810.1 methyltransferase family protein [Halopolyspora algeriensis]